MASESAEKPTNHAAGTLFSTLTGGLIGLLLGKIGDTERRKEGQWVLSLGGALAGYLLSMYANRRQQGDATVVETPAMAPDAPVSAPKAPAVPGPAKEVALTEMAHDGMLEATAREHSATR